MLLLLFYFYFILPCEILRLHCLDFAIQEKLKCIYRDKLKKQP